jgi:hypothetical protein
VLLGGEVVVDYSIRLRSELGREATWVVAYGKGETTTVATAKSASGSQLKTGKEEGSVDTDPRSLNATCRSDDQMATRRFPNVGSSPGASNANSPAFVLADKCAINMKPTLPVFR